MGILEDVNVNVKRIFVSLFGEKVKNMKKMKNENTYVYP